MSGELSGALRERVVIEQRLGAGWAAGEPRWAEVVPETAGVVQADGETRVQRRRWWVRCRAEFVPNLSMRVRWRGRALRLLRREEDPRAPGEVRMLVEDMDG
ncbi:phage head completion protein [Sandaracinobacteroides saxicola]|uniref:Head-tail adaptor protein n=1 Tax=Sandaracinobacteroides saxicola TaxID=2759707 RepID=A0A7G5IJ42_9SPHN|nr:hypothetical protein [Sandaracinobacteroides saxicola]QMW23384.1 hypothetical protein H3309_02455 [Sandaracinobacteroides saxicola]